MRGSHGLSAGRARRTKSIRPEGPKTGPSIKYSLDRCGRYCGIGLEDIIG